MSNSDLPVQNSQDAKADDATATPSIDQAALNFTQSQAGTSYTNSLFRRTGGSTTCDDDSSASVYSYNTRDASKFLKEVEGRTFNVLSETYFLPTDEDEWTRLNRQHVAFTLGLSNHLYPAPETVKAILRPEQGKRKRILDLGSGTGAWTIAMAHQFPHAEVVGVDLAPCPDPDRIPTNCRFEIDDINLGLLHFQRQFDLVHCRLITTGIQDFKKVILDIERCLRPGGILIWVDIDFDMYSNNQYSYRPFATEENPTGSWFQRVVYEMRREAVNRGSDLDTAAAELDAGFWSHEMLDPETCRTASLYLPLGPWAQCRNPAQTQQLLWVGALMKQDAISMHHAVHPMLVKAGWPAETVEEWGRKADSELNGSHEPLWSRFMIAWGRKREAQYLPAPALSISPLAAGEASTTPYPNYYEYRTAEHSLRQAAIRNRGKPPPSLPPSLNSPSLSLGSPSPPL